MINIKIRRIHLFVKILFLLLVFSCKKEAGQGGRAIIKGKLFADNFYSKSFNSRSALADERVYLVYGNQKSCSDVDLRTGYDGSFEFDFLRKGKYKLYAYSLDTGFKTPCSVIPVVKEIEIKKTDEEFIVSDFVVYKDANQGGGATIKGKLFAKDYNSELTELNSSYYLPDEYVYLVFGNSEGYGMRTRTDEEGYYFFSGLREGTYRVYSFSKDLSKKSGSEIVSVYNDLIISEYNQEVVLPDLIVIK